jgi:hypothetical protein
MKQNQIAFDNILKLLIKLHWEMSNIVLTVDCRIKVHLDLQADKSTVVVKRPFFP